jgi:hypothetical protein
MKKITLFTIVFIALLYSCSKEESCSFTKSTFENKTYKTILKVDSNGIDITNAYISSLGQCYNPERDRVVFNSDGTYRDYQMPTTMVGCTTRNYTGTWDVKVLNGKNILKTGSTEGIIDAFDCNSFTFAYIDTIGQSIIKYTQKYVKI